MSPLYNVPLYIMSVLPIMIYVPTYNNVRPPLIRDISPKYMMSVPPYMMSVLPYMMSVPL